MCKYFLTAESLLREEAETSCPHMAHPASSNDSGLSFEQATLMIWWERVLSTAEGGKTEARS